jgi:hypothetical protein
VFDYNGGSTRSKASPCPGASPIDVLRFQQSLVFMDGGTNRFEDVIRTIREACRGRPADVANPAGLDDPRCARQ